MKPEMLVFLGILVNSITLVVMGFINFRMKQLERNTNSKMDQLLTVTGEAEKAKGITTGRAQVRAEIKEDAKENS